MKIKVLLFFAGFVFFFSGCHNTNKDSRDYAIINIESKVNELNRITLTELNTAIKYVRLDNSVPLRGIFEADFRTGLMLVSDRNHCLLFNSDGKLMSEISRKGTGPEEFRNVSSLSVGNESILIYDRRVLKRYSYDGTYLETINLPDEDGLLFMEDWFVINDSVFIAKIPNRTGKMINSAVLFNMTGRILKSYPNYITGNERAYRPTLMNFADIYSLNGFIHYRDWMNDTVFIMDSEFNLIPEYYLDLGRYKQPYAEIFSKSGKTNQYDYLSLGRIFKTNEYLIINCLFNNYSPAKRDKPLEIRPGVYNRFYAANTIGIYNKASEDLKFSKPIKTENRLIATGITNDIDGGPSFVPGKMVNDSVMVMWFDAFELKNHVKSKYFQTSKPANSERKNQLLEFANSLTGDDNPVLMFVTFKE